MAGTLINARSFANQQCKMHVTHFGSLPAAKRPELAGNIIFSGFAHNLFRAHLNSLRMRNYVADNREFIVDG